ncbi:hypothetical protein CBS101457_003874 [Exobasidium rhododendri]|nr:hypothetical protein CBS101457_003874 [Exobasidium rhododendri]
MASESHESSSSASLVVGVLALQGAFREHLQHIERLNPYETSHKKILHLQGIPVRKPSDLEQCSALIIPGGESTAIALGAQRAGLLEPLRAWVRDDKPTWGTCAGMILLAREASGGKKSGQELLGGLDIRVGRNGFGTQVDSFEEQLSISGLSKTSQVTSVSGSTTFSGVFIRAPIIDSLLLPYDILSVKSTEPTLVARGQGEPHENLVIKPQRRQEDDTRPPIQLRLSSLSSVTSASSSSSSSVVQLAVAPPLERAGEKRKERPPLEILATLSRLPRGAKGSVGGAEDKAEESTSVVGNRPAHDSMIVALKQGRIMCTSFHPELTNDARLHEFFIRTCACTDSS